MLCLFFPSTTDFEKISASLFAPTRHPTLIPVGPPFAVQRLDSARTEKENNDTDSDDSGVETKKEWIDKDQLTELAQRFPSKVSEVMIIEVHQHFFFFF